MSTLNFWNSVDGLPLVVMGDNELLEYYGREETVDPLTECEYAWDEWQWDIYPMIEDLLDKLNKDLSWYKVEFKSGYYEGVYFYTNCDWVALDKWSDNDFEEMEYYFGVSNVRELAELIQDEQKMIRDFLQNMIEEFGFTELIHAGTFSNGEGLYYYKDKLMERANG